MPNEITELDQGIIKNEMLRKSHKEIAALLELPVEDVSLYICLLVKDTDIITRQMQLDASKQLQADKPKRTRLPKAPKAVKVKKARPVSTRAAAIKREKEEAKKLKQQIRMERMNAEAEKSKERRSRRQPMFKTKEVDYNKLRTVRVDAKTVIYARPNETDDQVIKRFKKNYSKHLFKNTD